LILVYFIVCVESNGKFMPLFFIVIIIIIKCIYKAHFRGCHKCELLIKISRMYVYTPIHMVR